MLYLAANFFYLSNPVLMPAPVSFLRFMGTILCLVVVLTLFQALGAPTDAVAGQLLLAVSTLSGAAICFGLASIADDVHAMRKSTVAEEEPVQES